MLAAGSAVTINAPAGAMNWINHNRTAPSNCLYWAGAAIMEVYDKTGRKIMNRLSCYFEKISDTAVGLFLLFLGLILTVISFTIIPVIGLVVAIPVLFLAVSFLGAKKSKECALITKSTRKILSG